VGSVASFSAGLGAEIGTASNVSGSGRGHSQTAPEQSALRGPAVGDWIFSDGVDVLGVTKKAIRVLWAEQGFTSAPSLANAGARAAASDFERFGLRLVEDSIFGVNTYVEFLCKLHSKIVSMWE
jgi:hypothetical protein